MNEPLLTYNEQRFLRFFKDSKQKNKNWTYRTAALALGWKSANSISRVVKSLRQKGYKIESPRSKVVAWKRTT